MYKVHLGFALNIIALGLLFPGILLPMFSLNMEMLAAVGGSSLQTDLVNKQLCHSNQQQTTRSDFRRSKRKVCIGELTDPSRAQQSFDSCILFDYGSLQAN